MSNPGATDERSFPQTLRAWFGYNMRVVTGRQRPVKFGQLPRDVQLAQAALAPFLVAAVAGIFVEAAWLEIAKFVLFAVWLGLNLRSLHISQREVERYTPTWAG